MDCDDWRGTWFSEPRIRLEDSMSEKLLISIAGTKGTQELLIILHKLAGTYILLAQDVSGVPALLRFCLF